MIDFLLPTYKELQFGRPEFKRIWLSATFVTLPLFASFPLQNHADEFKIPRFFISSSLKLKGFHYQIKYQLREPTICQIFSKNANGLAKKLFFASFEMLLLCLAK